MYGPSNSPPDLAKTLDTTMPEWKGTSDVAK